MPVCMNVITIVDNWHTFMFQKQAFWGSSLPTGIIFAGLAEQAYATVSNTVLFRVRLPDSAFLCSRRPTAELTDLNPVQCEFESHREHQDQYTQKGDVFNAGDRC